MEIRIDPHTLERAEERGTNAEEIREVIHAGSPIPARHGRRAKARIFQFQEKWGGRYYEEKRVEVVYTVEGDLLITVTVYVFYGSREKPNADSVQREV
jgi:hypothetical protein